MGCADAKKNVVCCEKTKETSDNLHSVEVGHRLY
jgi:hypothetical protein